MALPVKKTLGTLRAELLGRLGFAAQGAAAGNMVTAVDSYLQRSQEFLYWMYDFNELKKKYDWTLNAGQTLYDWPDDMDPRQATILRVKQNSQWFPLSEGIDYFNDATEDSRTYPSKYDRAAQLEVYPEPDQTYILRCDYYERLGRFTQDNDKCTIDDGLLFNYALAKAKAHYKHADAQSYIDDVSVMLKKLKGKAHGDKRYFMAKRNKVEIMPRPVVVG